MSAISGVVLLVIFLRFGALQQEFLNLNFDAVHSTRALLRAEVLLTRAVGDMRLAERDPQFLQSAVENLEAALIYERNGQYKRSEHELAVINRAQTLLADMQGAARNGNPNIDDIRLYTRRLREVAQRFSDTDGDRWGGLFSLNTQLRSRMESNRLFGFAAAALLLALTGVICWSVIRKRRLDALVELEKRHLENEIGQRKRTEMALRNSEVALFSEKERAQVTLASIGEAVVTTRKDGRIEFLNPAAEKLCDWKSSEARDRPLSEVLVLRDDITGVRLADIWQQFSEGGTRIAERAATLVSRQGEEIAVELTAAPILDHDCLMTGLVVVLRDVREARLLERELSWQASHDALTGLFSRREFENRLGELLERRSSQQTHAMLYLDLDQFKVVNDTCGHAAGDELLRQIGHYLASPLRSTDTLARLGGDEFGVLLFDCNTEFAIEVASRLRESIESIQFGWDGKTFSIGVSIGLVHFTASGLSIQDVMSRTDAACYMAKDLGRNRIQVYRKDDDEIVRRYDEMEWVGRIRQALRDGRFVLYRQPIVPLPGSGRQRRHEEVLLRMQDENGELVPPINFIPAAERYGLMAEIDRWVIAETLRLCSLEPVGREAPVVAINLSGASLGNEQLVTYICECLEQNRVNPRRICFEITETAAVTHLERAIRLIQSLKLVGCRFALDDFGSGMSSFNYLRRLPADYLKIDGSFVRGIDGDAINRAMVRSINEVGHSVGLKTVAESVETEAELAVLREIGVDFVQGYHLGRPAPWGVGERKI
ncbi:MAG: EAL domain-containing protein [Betaproteobacteria bacterium]